VQTEQARSRSVAEPRLFEHELDPELFSAERLDELCRIAWRRNETHPRRRSLDVQLADPGRERPGLNEPVFTEPRFPVIEDCTSRQVQYRLYDLEAWAGPEYAEARDHVLDVAAPDESLGRVNVTTTIRVFSPGAVVALHTDVDLKLVSTIAGETIWWLRPPEETSPVEHENLLHGRFFLPWREGPDRPLAIPPGTGCFVPCRWAHWLEHPADEPTISFEMGFWTYDAIRQRKVYDVNWALRRLRVEPTPPGVIPGRDRLKSRLFDLASVVARKGEAYRSL
jgi:hypothetical protein